MKRVESEVELVRASLKGNTQAFEVLVRRYQSLVCAITYSGTGRVDTSEELAQETLLLAWKNLGQLRELEKFPAWLCRIARSTVRSWLRKRQQDKVQQAVPLEFVEDQAAVSVEPTEAVIQQEQETVVQQAIEAMPEKYREPLVLYYREHASTKEVGQLLNLPEGTVRQRIARARTMLKGQVATMVESTLKRSRPDAAFTAVVMASVVGVTARRSAAAVTMAKVGAGGGGAGVTALLGGLGAKLLVGAAGVAVVAGGILVHKHLNRKAAPGQEVPPVTQVAENENAVPASGPETIEVPETLVTNNAAVEVAADPCESQGVTQVLASTPSSIVVGDPTEGFKPRGVLSGLITDMETGAPIGGVDVRISDRRIERTKSDPNGFYSFAKIRKNGNYRVELTSKHYLGLGNWDEQPVVALTRKGQVVKHFALQRGCLVDVQVQDVEGNPLNDVPVRASWLGADRGHTDLGRDETDVNGRVRIGAFKPAEIAYRIIVHHKEYAPAHKDLVLTDPNTIPSIKVVLVKGEAVQGFIEYADGVPASGIEVGAKPEWWHSNYIIGCVPVDEEGMFTLAHVVPGPYDLSAHFDNPNGEGGYSFSIAQAQFPLPSDELLTLRIPKKSPQSLVSIKGRIIWKTKEQGEYLSISAYGRDTGVREHVNLHTKLDSFEINSLEPGNYTLRFDGSKIKTKTLENVPAPTNDLEVVLEYEAKPRLQGQVVIAASGEPVSLFRTRMIKQKTLRGSHYIPSDKWIQCRDGRFDLEAVGPGVYQVQVLADAMAMALSPEINTDESESILVKLTPGGQVTGRIVDTAGQPISNATIMPLSVARANTHRNADLFVSEVGAVKSKDGLFHFEHLTPGNEAFKVIHPDYCSHEIKDIEVKEGQVTECPEIVLQAGATIVGRVYNAAGEPEANVTLFAQDHHGHSFGNEAEATRLGVVVTDPNGGYRFEHLPPYEVCYVMRNDRGGSNGVQQRACIPIPGKEMRLDLGGTFVVRGVVEKNGVPIPKTRVQVGTVDSTYSRIFRCYGQTDVEGRFAVYGVPEGNYGLYYQKPAQRGEWELAAVFQGGANDLDLGIIPQHMRAIEVQLRFEDEADSQKSWKIYAQVGTEFWGRKAGDVTAPSNPEQPYRIAPLRPGVYQIVAQGEGYTYTLRQTVTVLADEDAKIVMTIPVGSASVSGSFLADNDQPLLLWNEDGTVTAYISSQDGFYNLDSLPAGDYTAGNYSLKDKAPVAAFELREGEAKVVDLDTRNWSPELALLRLRVVSEDGQFLNHAEVWLESPGQPIVEPHMSSEGYYFAAHPGDYALAVRCPGYTLHTESITLSKTPVYAHPTKQEHKTVILKRE